MQASNIARPREHARHESARQVACQHQRVLQAPHGPMAARHGAARGCGRRQHSAQRAPAHAPASGVWLQCRCGRPACMPACMGSLWESRAAAICRRLSAGRAPFGRARGRAQPLTTAACIQHCWLHAGGLLFPFFVGVAEGLRAEGLLTQSTPVAGASAGSLIAACCKSGAPPRAACVLARQHMTCPRPQSCCLPTGLSSDEVMEGLLRLAVECKRLGTRHNLVRCCPHVRTPG